MGIDVTQISESAWRLIHGSSTLQTWPMEKERVPQDNASAPPSRYQCIQSCLSRNRGDLDSDPIVWSLDHATGGSPRRLLHIPPLWIPSPGLLAFGIKVSCNLVQWTGSNHDPWSLSIALWRAASADPGHPAGSGCGSSALWFDDSTLLIRAKPPVMQVVQGTSIDLFGTIQPPGSR